MIVIESHDYGGLVAETHADLPTPSKRQSTIQFCPWKHRLRRYNGTAPQLNGITPSRQMSYNSHFHKTLIASPESPQLEMLSSMDGSKSCGGNLAFSSNGFPSFASGFDCF